MTASVDLLLKMRNALPSVDWLAMPMLSEEKKPYTHTHTHGWTSESSC